MVIASKSMYRCKSIFLHYAISMNDVIEAKKRRIYIYDLNTTTECNIIESSVFIYYLRSSRRRSSLTFTVFLWQTIPNHAALHSESRSTSEGVYCMKR